MAIHRHTGSVLIDNGAFLFKDSLLLLLFGDHRDSNDPVADFCKLLRHFELRHELAQQIGRERAEAVIRQTCDQKCTGNNIIDFSIFIPQGTVERQAFQLALFIANNGNRLRKGIDGLNTPADFMLQGLKAGRDFFHIGLLVRLDHQHSHCSWLFQFCAASGDAVLIGNIFKRAVKVAVPAIAGRTDVPGVGQCAAFIDCAVFPVPLKVDVVHKAAELVVNVVAALKEVVTTEIVIVLDVWDKIIVVEIVGQVNQIVEVIHFIAAAIHDCHKMLKLRAGHLIQPGCEVVELVEVFIFPKEVANPVNGAVIIGDEPLFIDLTELVFRANTDPLEHFFHLILGGRKLHPLTDKFPFIILSEVGHKRFKTAVQNRHRHPPFNRQSCCPVRYIVLQTLHH